MSVEKCSYMASAEKRELIQELVQSIELPAPLNHRMLIRQVAICCRHDRTTCGIDINWIISELKLAIKENQLQRVSNLYHYFQERMIRDQFI